MDIPSLTSIAKRANIKVAADEYAALVSELGAVMAYIRSLPPAESYREPSDEACPLRPDMPAPGLGRNAILAAAPDSKDGLFRVPPVFEEGGS